MNSQKSSKTPKQASPKLESSTTRGPLSLKLTPRGINIDYQELCKILTVNELIKLRKKLTIRRPVLMGKQLIKENIMRLFKLIDLEIQGTTKRILLVARQSGILKSLQEIAPDVKVKCSVSLVDGEDLGVEKFDPGVDPTSNQEVVIDYLTKNIYNSDRIRNGNGTCILVMPTGTGKSYTAALLIEAMKKKTLIILPNTSMLNDWLEMFKKYYPDLQIGQYHTRVKSDGDVVFTTINSALSDYFKIPGSTEVPYYEYFSRFGLVIYDEVHNYPTKKYEEIFWRAGMRCVLGMTATPDERNDKMDEVYYKHLGKLVYGESLEGYNKVDIKWKGEVEVIKYHGPPEFTQKITNARGWTKTSSMYEQFANDPYRTKLILQKVKTLRENNHNPFVWAEQREYLIKLCAELKKADLPVTIPEMEMSGTMMGGIKPDEKKRVEQAGVILMTYGYGKEGISIVRMDTELFATPRKNKMRQILGRILRRGGDPSVTRKIIDIVDYDTPLRNQYYNRKQVYEEKGFAINEIDVYYQEISL